MAYIKQIDDILQKRKQNILGHEQASKSAVLLPLIEKDDQWHVLFEVRSQHLKRQPGEICFPGGRVDDQDPSFQDTAIRETCEELQIAKETIYINGALDILVQTPHLLIYPYVGIIQQPDTIKPNEEVAETFSVPLSWLLTHKPERYNLEMSIDPNQSFPFELIPNGKNYNWRTHKKPEYFYRYNTYIIWGLTAQILRHFLFLIHES